MIYLDLLPEGRFAHLVYRWQSYHWRGPGPAVPSAARPRGTSAMIRSTTVLDLKEKGIICEYSVNLCFVVLHFTNFQQLPQGSTTLTQLWIMDSSRQGREVGLVVDL